MTTQNLLTIYKIVEDQISDKNKEVTILTQTIAALSKKLNATRLNHVSAPEMIESFLIIEIHELYMAEREFRDASLEFSEHQNRRWLTKLLPSNIRIGKQIAEKLRLATARVSELRVHLTQKRECFENGEGSATIKENIQRKELEILDLQSQIESIEKNEARLSHELTQLTVMKRILEQYLQSMNIGDTNISLVDINLKDLDLILEDILSGDIINATIRINKIVLRLKKDDSERVPLQENALRVLESAKNKLNECVSRDSIFPIGYRAIDEFSDVHENMHRLHQQYNHNCDDRFMQSSTENFVKQIADPDSIKYAIGWILYWSVFKATEENIKEFRSGVSEDAMTAQWAKGLANVFEGDARDWLKKFGYLDVKIDIGKFLSMGTKVETQTGADIGFIFDIRLEDVSCIKVFIMQIKCNNSFYVNIHREKNRQISQLLKVKNLGYYGFIHQPPTKAPAMTVRSAKSVEMELMSNIKESDTTIDKLSPAECYVNPFEDAYDIASLFAFGLASPYHNSLEFGVVVESIEEALLLLTEDQKGKDKLVSQLIFHSIGQPYDKKIENIFERNNYWKVNILTGELVNSKLNKQTPKKVIDDIDPPIQGGRSF